MLPEKKRTKSQKLQVSSGRISSSPCSGGETLTVRSNSSWIVIRGIWWNVVSKGTWWLHWKTHWWNVIQLGWWWNWWKWLFMVQLLWKMKFWRVFFSMNWWIQHMLMLSSWLRLYPSLYRGPFHMPTTSWRRTSFSWKSASCWLHVGTIVYR